MAKPEQKEVEKNDSRYPKWKYHAKRDAEIVDSSEEERALGEGWKDSPADFGVITAPSRDDIRKMKGLAQA